MSRRSCAFARASEGLLRSDGLRHLGKLGRGLGVLITGLLLARPSYAVRFGLGVATDVTPIVIDPERKDFGESRFLFGFRPVLEIEASHFLSFGAYAPFTVFRAGGAGGAASSGAESVFGVSASGRVPFFRDREPDEILAYGTLRGGFGTVDGRAGPFLGGALGISTTWLSTGRGLFAEIGLSHLSVAGVRGGNPPVDRLQMGISIGLVFHLGGEDWRIGRT